MRLLWEALYSPTQVEFPFHSQGTWIGLPIIPPIPAVVICLSLGLLVLCALFTTAVYLAPSLGAQ